MEEKTLNNIIQEGLVNTKVFVMKQFNRMPCITCDYNQFCANSGFHMYNYVLNQNKEMNHLVKESVNQNECYHIAKKLFHHYYEQLNKEDVLKSMNSN